MFRDLHSVLDEEVARLPERYRAAFILCCMEDKSYAQAARVLGCTAGTVSSRVARARERLRSPLIRRGVCSAADLAPAAPAAVPPALADAVMEVVRQATPGGMLGATKAAVLAKGVLQAMFFAKMKIIAGALLVVACGAGVGLKYQEGQGGAAGAGQSASSRAPGRPPEFRSRRQRRFWI